MCRQVESIYFQHCVRANVGLSEDVRCLHTNICQEEARQHPSLFSFVPSPAVVEDKHTVLVELLQHKLHIL